MVRGRLMPIVRLHQRFAIEPRTANLTEGTLIVAESEGRPFCLFVDSLVGKQQVVIKGLGQRFQEHRRGRRLRHPRRRPRRPDPRYRRHLQREGLVASLSLISTDPTPVLNEREFEKISRLAYEHFGLDLRGGKQGLVSARLGKEAAPAWPEVLSALLRLRQSRPHRRCPGQHGGPPHHQPHQLLPRAEALRLSAQDHLPSPVHAFPDRHLERCLLQRRGAILDRHVAARRVAA